MSENFNEDQLFIPVNSILIGDSKPEGRKITYRKGDIIVNVGDNMEDEPMYLCVEAGCPGEWIVIGSGSAETGVGNIDIDTIVSQVKESIDVVEGPQGEKGEQGEVGPQGPAGKDFDPAEMEMMKERIEALEEPRHVIAGVPEGTKVDYLDGEIRVMCPVDAEFKQQSVGENGNPNIFYMSMTTKAPEGAVAFNEVDGSGNESKNEPVVNGKKTIWLALAQLSGGSWIYYGKNSNVINYIGWDYVIEWLDAESNIIRVDKVRINLTNEACHDKSIYSAVKELYKMFKFNTAGELEVTINGVTKVFVPKE